MSIRRLFERQKSRLKPDYMEPARFAGPIDMPPHLQAVMDRVIAERLSYLPAERLRTLASLSLDNEREKREGIIIEAGCGMGGSALVLCAAKARERELRIYDKFGMIPSPGPKDGQDAHDRYRVIQSGLSEGIAGDLYYGYVPDLQERVEHSFRGFGFDPFSFNASFTGGLLQQTMFVDGPVALAHIDVDWYEPVTVCLQRICPKLVPGGCVVVDDYNDWSGCARACEDYFRERRDLFWFDDSFGPLVARFKG